MAADRLSHEELDRGVRRVLESPEADPRLAPSVVIEAETNLSETIAEAVEMKMLDPAFLGGGAAFLWDDILTLADAQAAVNLALAPMSPNQQAKVLLRLVLLLRRVRGKRVMLDETEFRIMLVVKRLGPISLDDIAGQCEASREQLLPVIEKLEATEYRDGIFLLEKDAAGNYVTRF